MPTQDIYVDQQKSTALHVNEMEQLANYTNFQAPS